jgi:hypothetical protein
LAATVALLEPVKSAVSNWNEIGIGFSELFAGLAVPFGITFVGIAAFAVLLTAVAPRRAVPILIALYVALWAQGSLFVWEYGKFDGSPIDWNEHFGKGLIEIAFWAAMLALAIIAHAWIRRRALVIMAIAFALQLAALAGQIRQNAPFPEQTKSKTSAVHDPGISEASLVRSVNLFSGDLNVIIIVLDTLQSDFFSEAMRDPELRAAMPPGFTYFRNAISLYASTEHSLQSILTSHAIPDNVDLDRWRREQVPRTLPARLAERGFDAVLTTFSREHYGDFGSWGYNRLLSATLAESGSASTAWREDVSNLFALGIFRLSPHFVKPKIYDHGRWKISRLYPLRTGVDRDPRIQYETRTDLATFDELIASAAAGDVAPRFRFFHFYGTHRPYTVDKNCDYLNDKAISRANAVATTHCILSRVFEFLHKLDAIGVYDQSLIFVLADHGEKYVKLDPSAAWPELPEAEAVRDTDSDRGATRIDHPWQGVPLFLAKSFSERQPLQISDDPVSLCDVPNSVVDALAVDESFECESIFSNHGSRRTLRMHYRYPTSMAERRARGMSANDRMVFQKFTVVGHSWRPESWVAAPADQEQAARPPSIDP